jgi:sugar phosphate permease
VQKTNYKVYGYRWIILSVFMLAVAASQIMWITFAPITLEASDFYGVSDIKIGILSMCFMIVYLFVSLPASWVIDKYGIRIGVGIGVVLTGIFGLLRGLFSAHYNPVLLSQIGLAIGQPFLLNAITKVAARWFPLKERATASGLATLSMYIGILGGMILTPNLIAGSSIVSMLRIYGVFSIVAAIVFFIFIKERPLTAPCDPDQEERALVLDGLKRIFHFKDFNWLMLIFFIGLGVFNGVTTWIENILSPRGFSALQAGTTGGLMIVGGIVGALILPILSDRYRKRIPFILVSLAGSTLSLAGVTFASNYTLILISGIAFGFFLLSSGPIGFQYGAEITYPVSEGTSNGLLILMGQISGIAFIFGMDSFKSSVSGSMTSPLIVLIALMFLSFIFATRLKESSLLQGGSKKEK